MKRLLILALILVGSSCAAQAQLATPVTSNDQASVAMDFAGTSAARVSLIRSNFAVNKNSLFVPDLRAANGSALDMVLALPSEAAEPPAPSPKPKFLYGGRDDYRFQLGFGFTLYRFQNSVFNATAFGIKTSVTYFLNDWLGIEGNVSSAFAPTIFVKEHVKTVLYGGGPKIAWRQRQWEPWMHAIFGGAHEMPQTSKGGKNAFAMQLGGGADYRFNPRLSGRLQGDYVRSTFWGQAQNNYEASAGIVVHF